MVDEVGLSAQQIEISSDVDPILLADGLELIRQEKTVPLGEAFRHHWRAVLWSVALSFALVMDGYDGSIANAFYALPAFLNRFGSDFEKDGKLSKQISGNWQTAINCIGLPGNLLALYVVGWASDRFGYRRTYAAGMVVTACIVFMFVFLRSIAMLLAANALMSFCWGLFQTLTAAYAVELCPIRLRGQATSFISMAWGAGGFLASGITRAALQIEGDWGWRMPYCLQWVWPVPLFLVAIFAPESPIFLVRQGRLAEAEQVLKRIASPGYYDNRNLHGYVAFLRHSDEIERVESRKGSFSEMFKGTNLRRTEIMLCLWACQQWSGLSLSGMATQMLKNAGMSTTDAFNMNMIVTSMNLVGCAFELCIIHWVSRRFLLLSGMVSLAINLLLVGIMGTLPGTHGGDHVNKPAVKAIAAFTIMINLIYHITIGPITYTIAAEIPSSRLRARTIALGRAFYACNGMIVNQLTPRMTALSSWNWGAKAGFFYCGTCALITIWAFFRVPETGGFSFAELEILFTNKVGARKFTRTRVRDEAAGFQTFDGDSADDDDEKKVTTVQINEVSTLDR